MERFFRKNYFLISIGAVPWALLRWQINEILIVNIIGCFLLGFINACPISTRYKLTFAFGFCGSLTTFSGWTYKLTELINQGSYTLLFVNGILFVLIGLFAVGLGDFLAKKLRN